MKRGLDEDLVSISPPETPSKVEPLNNNRLPTLQQLVVQKVVSSFTDEASFKMCIGCIKNPSVKLLLEETWFKQQQAPGKTLVTHKRKLRKASLVLEYLDSKEMDAGILNQVIRRHETDIGTDVSCAKQLLDYGLQTLQLKVVPSRQHKSLRFFLY